MEKLESKQGVILFDGVCNFCNSTIIFILKRDQKKNIYFASLQSETGKKLLVKYQLPILDEPDSIVYLKDEKVYLKSSAAIEIMKSMGGIYSLAVVFKIIPVFLRNLLYDFIARNRYKWFGKKDTCMIPSPDIKGRFLS